MKRNPVCVFRRRDGLRPCIPLAVILLAVAVSQPAYPQVTASMSGIVRDRSGAVIGGSDVTVTSLETGVARTASTDSAGNYRVLSLPVGRYSVKAEKQGFEPTMQTGINLVVGQDAVVNLTLDVGTVQQQVTITAEAPLVDTTLSSTSGLVGEQQVKDLPLNGRSFDQLLTLNTGTANFTSNLGNGRVGNVFSVAGRRPDENRFLINGVDYPGQNNNGDAFMPTGASGQMLGVDAVREFNVVQHTYGAEYGKYSGGQISVVTSSGSNQFHGSAFEFLRNSALDARSFFDVQSAPNPTAVPPFKRNQFGGSAGGPLKHDKLFLFGNYEGFRYRLGVSNVAIVPDAQARLGNLPIAPDHSLVPAPLLKPGMLPYAQSFWPSPNGPNLTDANGFPTGLAYNYSNPAQKIREDFGLTRIDYNRSATDSISGSVLVDDGENDTPAADPYFVTITPQINLVSSLQETHIFSPTLLNVATLGYGRAYQSSGTLPTVPIPANLLFLTGSTPGTITIGGGAISTVAASVTGPNGGSPIHSAKNLFTWADDVHLTRGSHSVSLGVWIQRVQQNSMGASSNTSGGVAYPTLQAFLQDQPSSFLVAPSVNLLGFRTTQTAWYVQDDFKLRPNLSLRLGLRDEMTSGFNEVRGRASNYIYDANGVIQTNPLVGPSGLTQNNAIALWQPRLGLAWDPNGSGKWSVRAGFSISNDLQDNLGFRLNANPPYAGRVSLPGPMLALVPIKAGVLPPPCNASSPLAPPACAIYQPGAMEPNMHTPTIQQWSFTIQRQITGDLMLQLGYVGSQSYHLINYMDKNVTAPQVCADPQGCDSGGVNVRPVTATAPARVPQGTTYVPPGPRPNPYVSFTQSWFYSGVSSYHALNASLVKRTSHGLSFKVNYTFGKVIDMNSGLDSRQHTNEPATIVNPFNLALSKGLAAFNLQQQFNGNFTFALPFGQGQRWGGGAGGFMDKLIGGWQWNGIVTAQCGFPLTPSDGGNPSGTGDGSNPDVPNRNPAFTGPVVTGDPHHWYNPKAFLLPTAGTFGNLSRGALKGPGLFMFDTSFFKDLRITERVHMQFRAEFFNLLNRANFGTPSLPVFSGSNISASAGAITTTSTTSRQIQFALKLTF